MKGAFLFVAGQPPVLAEVLVFPLALHFDSWLGLCLRCSSGEEFRESRQSLERVVSVGCLVSSSRRNSEWYLSFFLVVGHDHASSLAGIGGNRRRWLVLVLQSRSLGEYLIHKSFVVFNLCVECIDSGSTFCQLNTLLDGLLEL